MLALAAHAGQGAAPGQSPAQDLTNEEDPPPAWLIRNVVRWLPLVERWSPEFPDLEHELVLAVIAQESQGFPEVEGSDGWGSVGLMQVIPRSWTGTRQELLDPAFNIHVGMRMLSAILEDKRAEGDLRIALAAYNCGWKTWNGRLSFKFCMPGGGVDYADRILGYWLPIFRAELGSDDPLRDEWFALPHCAWVHRSWVPRPC